MDSVRSNYYEFQGDTILKWYHENNIDDYLKKYLKENELMIWKLKTKGYTYMEISQELRIHLKRVYYVSDKIKKLLLCYID